MTDGSPSRASIGYIAGGSGRYRNCSKLQLRRWWLTSGRASRERHRVRSLGNVVDKFTDRYEGSERRPSCVGLISLRCCGCEARWPQPWRCPAPGPAPTVLV